MPLVSLLDPLIFLSQRQRQTEGKQERKRKVETNRSKIGFSDATLDANVAHHLEHCRKGLLDLVWQWRERQDRNAVRDKRERVRVDRDAVQQSLLLPHLRVEAVVDDLWKKSV